ncbi:hypothetical protein DNH61_25605 [Paenibacillus sambharensis]|uniref:SLH domain-containing protein n=1 Tax=Paenibacillus sambharensis TaxID=1803190 RepID=A0A2W1LNI6_9BACL|nr:S-layer homology domain-containing protein [Paenibacillus sambharensis]PZD92977.1 hypothetical protein DNH61_25605 [Paenibacillus sambharensis]
MSQKQLRKTLSALLAFSLMVSMFSASVFGAAAPAGKPALSDINSSYAKEEIQALVDKGIINGFEDGTFKPGETVTRAQLAKILVLSLNLNEDQAAAASFKDVASKDWYAGYVGALVKSGITQGTSATAFSPNKTVSREELAVFFIRAFGLEETAGKAELTKDFADMASVSAWAKSSVSFAYKLGFIKGIQGKDGSLGFNPAGKADRQALARLAYEFVTNKDVYINKAAELVPVKQVEKPVEEKPTTQQPAPTGTTGSSPSGGSSGGNGTGGSNSGGGSKDNDPVVVVPEGRVISQPGVYAFGNLDGSLTISSRDVTLKNTTIAGNLTITADVGDGDVALDQVTVNGMTIVRGGGVNSIHVVNSVLATVVVNKSDGSIRLVLEDGTNVQQLEIQSGAILETTAGVGEIRDVTVTAGVPHNAAITFNGRFHNLNVYAQQVTINVAEGSSINDLNVLEEAIGTTFNLGAGSTVARLIASAVVSFAGQGTIGSAAVNVEGVDFGGLNTTPSVAADPSVTRVVYGPQELTLTAIGATKQIVLTGIKYDNSNRDVTSFAAWSSDDAAIAEVRGGVVKAVANGATIIRAQYGSYNVEIPVTVTVDAAGYPNITGVHVTNGTVNLQFSQELAGLALSDLSVTAVVYGEKTELENLQYSNGTITFTPVNSYGNTLYVTVAAAEDSTVLAGSQSGTFRLTGFGGYIKNVAGQDVAGLTIKFRKGLNAQSGPIVGEAVTDQYGNYFIYLQPGIYTGELGGEGTPYITTYLIGVAAGNVKNMDQNQTAIEVPKSGEVRIVLTWGKDPEDLDSHLIGPGVQSGQFHTWYGGRQYRYDGNLIADLDLDDVTSYGPETTTIRSLTPGTYKFYIHHYSGRSTIAASGAKIEVYQGSVSQPTVYEVPAGASERYWVVFEMTVHADGTITFTTINQLTDVDPAVSLTEGPDGTDFIEEPLYGDDDQNDYAPIEGVPGTMEPETPGAELAEPAGTTVGDTAFEQTGSEAVDNGQTVEAALQA